MPIIKLNATDSTNNYLKRLTANQVLEDGTVVVTDFQTSGRGQMGTIWTSEASKNLMFSILKDVSWLPIDRSYYISMATALAIIKTLHRFKIPKLHIKWPNDILSEELKICGVLIENVIKQNQLNKSIIGIGLNVNQTNFTGLPKASSLHLISGAVFKLDELLQTLKTDLNVYFKLLEKGKYQELKVAYEKALFRKDKPSTFKNAEGVMFSGFIKGVANSGNLQVLVENQAVQEFDLKQIQLLY
ncbi:MAG: biotin--[acetyl-CoA-carboxylase] ligase [Xanthomarina sp.]